MESDNVTQGIFYITDMKDNLIASINLDTDEIIMKDGFKVFYGREEDNELRELKDEVGGMA